MRLQLKQWTSATHDQLDQRMSMLILTDLGDYAVFLRTHHAAYAVLLETLPARHWMYAPIHNALADLSADLAQIGVKPMLPVRLEPRCNIHPLAVAYVVAGSHFGKHVLHRRWARSTDRAVLSAGAYLASDGLKQAWHRLMRAFDTITAPEQLLPQLGPDADRVFGLFRDCLEQAQKQKPAHAAA